MGQEENIMSNTKSSETVFSMKHFLLFILGVFAVWLIYWCLVVTFIGKAENAGVWGDMFGGLNSLFSGFAFAGVIFAILLQRQELVYQREELEAQRKEMKRFADAQEKAEEALSKQVHSMEVTAKLNALSAQIQAQSIMLGSGKGLKPVQPLIDKMNKLANLD